MSPEATAIFLLAAFIAFVVSAVVSWRAWPSFGIAVGLACWVLTLMWPAVKAL